jgi:WD40 repeat protein
MRLRAHVFKWTALLSAIIIVTLLIGASYSEADVPYFSPLWTRNVPALRDLSISPEAQRIAMLTSDYRVSVWDVKTAKPIWSKANQLGNRVKITDKVGYVFVYDLMNPMERAVKFYSSSTGDLITSYLSEKPIWDVAASSGGDYFAAGDSSGTLAIYKLLKKPQKQIVRLRGGCDKLAFAPDSSYLAVSVWNSSGIDLYSPNGALLVSQPGALARRFQPVISRDGNYVLGLQYDNHERRAPAVSLWNRKGQSLWSYSLENSSSKPRALIAKGASFTVLFYYKQVMRNHVWTPERRLAVIDSKGRLKFEIGGLYLSLSLMMLSADNNGFIAYDGEDKLYRFDRNGNTLETFELSAPIRNWAVSADNQKLLIHTIDNKLTLIQTR